MSKTIIEFEDHRGEVALSVKHEGGFNETSPAHQTAALFLALLDQNMENKGLVADQPSGLKLIPAA